MADFEHAHTDEWVSYCSHVDDDTGAQVCHCAPNLREAVDDLNEALDMLDNATSSFRDPTLRRTWGQKRKALRAKWER